MIINIIIIEIIITITTTQSAVPMNSFQMINALLDACPPFKQG